MLGCADSRSLGCEALSSADHRVAQQDHGPTLRIRAAAELQGLEQVF